MEEDYIEFAIKFIEDSVDQLIERRKSHGLSRIPRWDDLSFKVSVEEKENNYNICSYFVYKKKGKEYNKTFVRIRYDNYENRLYKMMVYFNSMVLQWLKFGKNSMDFDEIYAGDAKFGFEEDSKTFNELI